MYSFLDPTIEDSFIKSGLSLLPMQFKDSPNINSLLRGCISCYTALDAGAKNTTNAYILSSAKGIVLDNIGEVLRVYRGEGQDDDSYRSTIYTYIKIKNCQPDRDSIISFIQEYTGGGFAWMYTHKNYRVDLNLYSWCIGSYNFLRLLVNAFPTGTDLRICSFGRGYPLGFCSTTDTVAPSDVKGFGSASLSVGYEQTCGAMSSLQYSTANKKEE